MKRVTCWNDLRSLGFDPLTGEACGLGYRILFDLTEGGRKILGKCFGIPDMRLAEAWNRGAADDPSVGSVLLSHDMLVPVGIFALLESGCTEVWQLTGGELLGIEASDSAAHIEAAHDVYASQRVRTYRYGGTAGDRNRHVMSGRIT